MFVVPASRFGRRAFPRLAALGTSYAVTQYETKDGQPSSVILNDKKVQPCNCEATATNMAQKTSCEMDAYFPPVPAWKQELPPTLRHRAWLQKEEIVTKDKSWFYPWETEHVTEVFLFGGRHDGKNTTQNAKLLLHTVDPDSVFVELCKERCGKLGLNVNREAVVDCSHLYLCGTLAFTRLCSVIAFGAFGFGDGEMRAAVNYVYSQDHLTFIAIGDRPISITIRRLDDTKKKPAGVVGDNSLQLDELYGSKPVRSTGNANEVNLLGYWQLNKAWEERSSFSDFWRNGIWENEELFQPWLNPMHYENVQFPAETYQRVVVQEREISTWSASWYNFVVRQSQRGSW